MDAQKENGARSYSEEIALLVARCSQKALACWAADCAGRVLPVFLSEKPDDCRPALAITAAREWASGRLKMSEARKAAFAAHAAAREMNVAAAVAAARSCGHAAATAHVARHAVHAANYAANAISLSNGNKEQERKWQLDRLREYSCL